MCSSDLDSGAIYRIIALNAKAKNLNTNQITQILELIDGLEINFADEKVLYGCYSMTDFKSLK